MAEGSISALLCIDGSHHCDRALQWYLKNLHRKGNTIGLVHIHQMPHLSVGLYEDGSLLNTSCHDELHDSVEKSKEVLKKYKMLCEDQQIECVSFLRTCQYSVGESICSIAEEKHAEYIVIGQRGLGVIRRTLLGSVSDYVLHHSHIPIVVVPNSDE